MNRGCIVNDKNEVLFCEDFFACVNVCLCCDNSVNSDDICAYVCLCVCVCEREAGREGAACVH